MEFSCGLLLSLQWSMSVPRARAAALLQLASQFFSTFAVTIQSNSLNLSNTSFSHAPVLNDLPKNEEDDICFNPATPRAGLYPAKQEDCLNAVKELFDIRDPFRPITLTRNYGVGFKLPEVVQNGSCVISIDVMNDEDSDYFEPYLVYSTAGEMALRCTQDGFRFGGRAKAGPKKVVDVLVCGRAWPPEDGAVEPVTSEIVAGERLTSRDSTLLDESLWNLTKPLVVNDTGHDEEWSLGGPVHGEAMSCYDPPLPRERIWPINVEDCEVASQAIIGHRSSDLRYTFSRKHIAGELYYPLPATYRHGSCVVHLDMDNNSDQDTVRLSIVEATAWVLAHKCSGEETPVEQYGGWGKVSVGSQGLISVWVYGRPPQVGARNGTHLVLAQPPASINSE